MASRAPEATVMQVLRTNNIRNRCVGRQNTASSLLNEMCFAKTYEDARQLLPSFLCARSFLRLSLSPGLHDFFFVHPVQRLSKRNVPYITIVSEYL